MFYRDIFYQKYVTSKKCDIRFCLKDSECGNVGKNIKCDSNSPYKWVDRPEK